MVPTKSEEAGHTAARSPVTSTQEERDDHWCRTRYEILYDEGGIAVGAGSYCTGCSGPERATPRIIKKVIRLDTITNRMRQ